MKLTVTQIAELRAAMGQRGAVAEFCRKHSIAPPTVRRWAKKLGFADQQKKRGRRVEAIEDAPARLAAIPADTRPPFARMMGDPLPGRSALDMRGRA